MKKIVALLLAALLVVSFAACDRFGKDEPAQVEATPEPTPDESLAAELEASATDVAQANQTHTPPASPTDLGYDEELFAKAQECIGLTVQELYEAIGEPQEEPTYGPSCLQEDAEDGMLLYDGFYVWTIRTEESEIVHDVDLDEEPLEDELIDQAIAGETADA